MIPKIYIQWIISVVLCYCIGYTTANVTIKGDNISYNVPDWARLLVSQGDVADAKCNMDVIQTVNNDHLHDILDKLTNTTYFRLFGNRNRGECPLDPKTAPKADCGSDKPKKKKKKAIGGKKGSACTLSKDPLANLDQTISTKEDAALSASGVFSEEECSDDTKPQFWLNMCENLHPRSTDYVNLKLNPESFTGFNGSAVWKAMYEQNCFEKNGVHEMCYEERVMYRLLSGLHASINIHIAEKFYAPMKGIRDEWEPNPERFMEQFGAFPDRIKNLHFSFVVLLRALERAAPSLYQYEYVTGYPEEDKATKELIQQLFDSKVMNSCKDVFSAFDESLMFSPSERHNSTIATLKQDFKGVFQNITSLMDCVTCDKCRLHGRLQLLGVGTALKILLVPSDLIATTLERNEIVALINTIAKFSHAIASAPKLMELYWANHHQSIQSTGTDTSELTHDGLLDLIVGTIASAGKSNVLEPDDENALIDMALLGQRELFVLAKHYGDVPDTFLRHAVRALLNGEVNESTDAIIVGGGLGGLSAALAILDRGGRVTMIEKEGIFGGNSAKASSGVNGIDQKGIELGDSVELFAQDIIKGSGIPEYKDNPLVYTLAEGSKNALEWLRSRVGIPLELRGQLGGHSKARTHRPSDGMAGSEIVAAVKLQVQKYLEGDNPALKILFKTKVEEVLQQEGRVVGVKYTSLKDNVSGELKSENVILATGGFANDFASTDSLIKEHRPDLLEYSTTNGKFATGDGHKIASKLGASIVDMENIQLHPTGFVDRKEPLAKVKTLCAEILRGVGGILIDSTGNRFSNELGTRDYISKEMLTNARHNGIEGQPSFGLVLNERAASQATKHISTYLRKGLLVKLQGIDAVATYLKVPKKELLSTVQSYDTTFKTKQNDPHGKVVFPSMPVLDDQEETQTFYVGEVTPVLHYCMGGVSIDTDGKVLSAKDKSPIEGLFAAGELTGGIHGKNRLGGNALTECVVFGYQVGSNIELKKTVSARVGKAKSTKPSNTELPNITANELAQHNSASDAWIALHGKVYDFTSFVEDHPGGASSIVDLAGKDGTHEFDEVHSMTMLPAYNFVPIGVLK